MRNRNRLFPIAVEASPDTLRESGTLIGRERAGSIPTTGNNLRAPLFRFRRALHQIPDRLARGLAEF